MDKRVHVRYKRVSQIIEVMIRVRLKLLEFSDALRLKMDRPTEITILKRAQWCFEVAFPEIYIKKEQGQNKGIEGTRNKEISAKDMT